MRLPFSTARKWLLRLALCYMVGFLILWQGGGYVLTESGRCRKFLGMNTRISAPDVAQWQPFIGHFQVKYQWPGGEVSPRCSWLGWAYFPLLKVMARQYPTVTLLDENGHIVPDPVFPPGYHLHPLRGRELAGVTSDSDKG